jgi:hypothetical protein
LVAELKSKGVRFASEILSFTHVCLVEFQDNDETEYSSLSGKSLPRVHCDPLPTTGIGRIAAGETCETSVFSTS